MLSFTLHKTAGNARLGALSTAHGDIRTPAFMPVGTAATVKAMRPGDVRARGADVVLGNTYHLMLRPGHERLSRLGGLHKFMNWPHPILTDSGGFQVMSLAGLRKIDEQGVTFRSHLDGAKHVLTPEYSMQIQHALGSDITMAFDECTPFPATHAQAADSMRLSMRWAVRSKAAYVAREGYGLFGIVQGGVYADLREESARALQEIGFDGYAVGGLAVGEGQALMLEVLSHTVPHLPQDKPRYLMGVGRPDDIVLAVMQGIDMFDCVMPTRSARHSKAFTFAGEINLRNACHAEDSAPLEEGCPCSACTQFSRAYLHHLFKAGEMLGAMLLTEHNLTFYQRLMHGMREGIEEGKAEEFAKQVCDAYKKGG